MNPTKKPIIVYISRSIADALHLPVIVLNADGTPTELCIDTTILVDAGNTWREWPIVVEDEQA